jgi:hypothetical protein
MPIWLVRWQPSATPKNRGNLRGSAKWGSFLRRPESYPQDFHGYKFNLAQQLY